jgi:hypothetical protein
MFRLPAAAEIRNASKNLIGLSNAVHHADPYGFNPKNVKMVCDSLHIYSEL